LVLMFDVETDQWFFGDINFYLPINASFLFQHRSILSYPGRSCEENWAKLLASALSFSPLVS